MQDYEVLREIGHGSFGRVNKVRRKWDSKEMACKEVNYKNLSEKEKGQIVSEVNILRELQHPFIVRYFDRIIDKASSKLYIVMELCPGGDLGKVISKCQKENSTLLEDVIWKIFAQISSALKDCHRHKEGNVTKPILHRDIKPANIFLDSNQNIKIGDFGLAKELSATKTHTQTNVGTPFYMSPELINGRSYDERSDVWSLGCLLYELASLRPPHHDAKGTKDLVVKINSGRVCRIPKEYSNELWQTIQRLMSVDLSKRPRIEDIMDIKVPAFVKHMHRINQKVQEFNVSLQMEEKHKEYSMKEAEVARREKAVTTREQNVQLKETQLATKEKELVAKEAYLRKMETVLKDKEKMLAAIAPTTTNTTTSSVSPNTSGGVDNSSFDTSTSNSAPPVPTHVVAVKPCKPAAAVTSSNNTCGGFQIYADPPTAPTAATSSNETESMNMDIYDAPAGNTRRRSLTRVDSGAGAGVTPREQISEGVKRAKEILSRNQGQAQGQVAVKALPHHTVHTIMPSNGLGYAGTGKENSYTHAVGGAMPPPPPAPVCGGNNANATGAAVAIRKRPMTGLAVNPINLAHASNAGESPSKRLRYAGAPLKLNTANNASNMPVDTGGLLKPPPTFTFISNQQYKQNLSVKPANTTTSAAFKNQYLNQHQQQVREATALL